MERKLLSSVIRISLEYTPRLCGNNRIDSGEVCDGDTNAGCISCSPKPGYSCSFDPLDCQKCGDGILNGDEKCDGPKGCTSTCSIDKGYTCVKTLNGSTFYSNCTYKAECGNQVLDPEIGENCDDGNP